MAQQTLTYDTKSDNVAPVDRKKQATAADFNDIKTVVNNNANDVTDKFKVSVINLVKDTDYNLANPHTLSGAIPRLVQLKASDGTVILDPYLNVNQATGAITINVGANFNNAILTSIGW